MCRVWGTLECFFFNGILACVGFRALVMVEGLGALPRVWGLNDCESRVYGRAVQSPESEQPRA